MTKEEEKIEGQRRGETRKERMFVGKLAVADYSIVHSLGTILFATTSYHLSPILRPQVPQPIAEHLTLEARRMIIGNLRQ